MLESTKFESLFIDFCGCVCMSERATTDLHAYAELGDLERVQVLVGQGVDKDKVDDDGRTALLLAAWWGQLPIVRYLVEQGADIEKPAGDSGATPLMVASYHGRLDVVRYVLEQGADRDKAGSNGWTSLHCSAWQGHLKVAMLLMSYGADLNARSNAGQVPIDLARTEEMKQAIRDEPRRRMDHGHKRATEQDRHPNAAVATLASAQQNDKEEQEGEEGEQSNKKPRLDQEAIAEEEAKILAEINEDSEPSDDEEDD